jgi:dipeptidase E
LNGLAPKGKVGYVPNALDFSGADPLRKAKRIQSDTASLRRLDLEVELLDLRNYFGKYAALKNKLSELGAIFVSGGNVFVLRQAMKLSGLDQVLDQLRNTNFLYAGYSAAGCVLAPSLKAYSIVDPVDTPYPEEKELIWEGLGFVDWAFMPHWSSDHPDSADIDREIAYCKENNIPYKAIRDGEVIIIEY